MQTEIEAKFLDVDHGAMRAKLHAVGAICEQPLRLMRRTVYDFPDASLDKRHAWVRARDEGDKITMSFKQLSDRGVRGTKEVNLTVNSFDEADRFLAALGLKRKSYQETKRESWSLHDVQIELDEWPWIKPFIEIEAPSEKLLRETVVRLGLDWAKALHGSVEIGYQAEYDVTEQEVNTWSEILFQPVPSWLEQKRKTDNVLI